MEYKAVFEMCLGSSLPLLLCVRTPLCKGLFGDGLILPHAVVAGLGWGPAVTEHTVPWVAFPLMGSSKCGLDMEALQEVLGPPVCFCVW